MEKENDVLLVVVVVEELEGLLLEDVEEVKSHRGHTSLAKPLCVAEWLFISSLSYEVKEQ